MSDTLAARAEELQEEVARLRLAVEQLDERTAKAERVTFRTATGVGVLLIVVVLLGWVTYSQARTADRLDSLVQRSLCPVFSLVVGGYDPDTRPPGEGRDAYEQNHLVMVGAYNELHCSGPLVPKRQDG